MQASNEEYLRHFLELTLARVGVPISGVATLAVRWLMVGAAVEKEL